MNSDLFSGNGIFYKINSLCTMINVDFVELNVFRSADGMLIVYNSHKFPDGSWISKQTKKELQSLVSTFSFEFLKDILEWARGKNIWLSLDIKNNFGLSFEIFKDVAKLVSELKMTEKVIFISWDHIGLKRLKEINLKFITQASLKCRPVNLVELARAANVDSVSLSSNIVNIEQIDALHKAGIAISLFLHPDAIEDFGQDISCVQSIVEINKLKGLKS
jgi:glycerophosphoryl diester phosphodiesterase